MVSKEVEVPGFFNLFRNINLDGADCDDDEIEKLE